MVKLSDILDGRRGYLDQIAEFHTDPTIDQPPSCGSDAMLVHGPSLG